ncbi:MAG: L-aspartate oxidase [Hyphomicrobiaceae bacterium]|nr:MAG: L-aspartate oxidase [Hyphomicrobiaceae bacterium]
MHPIAHELAGRPIIVGGGLAGLMTALHLSPEPVVVLAKAPPASGPATAHAQGGIAAALGPDDDPVRHAADTIASGDGLCDAEVVARITGAAREAISELARRGVAFDRDADGQLAHGLEAAHSRRRIIHASGDQTGREIMRALSEAVQRTPSITVLESADARRLKVEDGSVAGVLALTPRGPLLLPGSRVVLATGGIGGLYRYTTNPLGCTGQGLALAARAGAVLVDMEFVQFHPTALDVGLDPMPLVSEAVRGEGAILIDETGTRFMADHGRAELEPRDVVARTVWLHLMEGHLVFLDARRALGSSFGERFPGITAACRAANIEPAVMPMPVRPAAHYHMGGIAVDEAGRSSLSGLWACGETAATGLHGANRLASNSLLEAVACARRVAESVSGTSAGRLPRLRPAPVPEPADAEPVRDIMSRHVGVLRDGAGLRAAVDALQPLAFATGAVADAAVVGLMIATAALQREESRGGHFRTDFRDRSARPCRLSIRLDEGNVVARLLPNASPAAAAGE